MDDPAVESDSDHTAADIAHQLRTQIQLLGVRLERLRPHVQPEGEDLYGRTVADVERVVSMLDMVLASGEVESSVCSSNEVDVINLVQERASAWMDAAAVRNIHIRIAQHANGVFVARGEPLRQALDVLLENAVRNSPPQGEIVLAVYARGQGAQIDITDQGPGMSAAERAMATTRGWSQCGEGHGLGLSIATRLLALNGGRLSLQPGPQGRGLTAHIELTDIRSSEETTPRVR